MDVAGVRQKRAQITDLFSAPGRHTRQVKGFRLGRTDFSSLTRRSKIVVLASCKPQGLTHIKVRAARPTAERWSLKSRGSQDPRVSVGRVLNPGGVLPS